MHAHDGEPGLACVAAVAATPVLALASVSAPAAGDHGPLTCLDGYVWRQATPQDHVCVTPAVRGQTARDNALAPSRRTTTPGTFGPDLCAAGLRLARGRAGRPRLRHPGHLAAGPRRQPHGRRPPQRAAA